LLAQTKKQIDISPTLSYRGYILELSNYNVRTHYPGYTNEFDKQFGLRSLGVDFSSDLIKGRLSVLLSSYFRYSYLYFDKTLNKEVKSFKTDLFADCFYNFGIKENRKFIFFAGIGLGKVNLGTKFKYAFKPAIDSGGNPYLKEAVGTFAFNTARVLVGLKKKRWAITINVIGTPDEDKNPNLSATLEGKISYSLLSFKVPVKK
jgi:hypothetical protein